MAIIGQGVQAGLGRIDYSPYMQGAVAGAQGIAQGLASFGQSVGSGIQNYLKKQEEKKKEQEGIEFIKNQFPGIDDKAAKAGLSAAGGPAAFVKFRNDQAAFEMQKKESELRLGELQRTIAERNKLEQFFTQTPAGAAIAGGASFENLPTGAAAFLPRQFGNAQEVLQAGQRAGIPITQLLPVATGLANLGETEAKAASLRAPKPKSIEELRFQTQQKQEADTQRINNRAREIAFGVQSDPLPSKQEELAAKAEASKIAEAGRTTQAESRVDKATGEIITEEVLRDITGKEIGRKPIYRPEATPEEKRRATIMTEQAKADVDWVNKYRDQASAASVRIAQNARAINLLASGDVKTGPGTPVLQAINRVFVSFGGSPEDIKKVANYGEATNLLAYQLLDYFSKTKGAISDTETALFRRFTANETKTPAENLAILRMSVQIDTRNQKALAEMNRQKITDPADQRRFLEQYAIDNPLDFSQLEAVSTAPSTQAIFDKADQIIKGSAKPTKR